MIDIYLINMQTPAEHSNCDPQVTVGVTEAKTNKDEVTSAQYFDFDSYSYFLIKTGYL